LLTCKNKSELEAQCVQLSRKVEALHLTKVYADLKKENLELEMQSNHVKEVQLIQEKITYLESVLQQSGVKQCAHKELQVSTRQCNCASRIV
jgi:hypothetical protein